MGITAALLRREKCQDCGIRNGSGTKRQLQGPGGFEGRNRTLYDGTGIGWITEALLVREMAAAQAPSRAWIINVGCRL